jgi:hypothetical protein
VPDQPPFESIRVGKSRSGENRKPASLSSGIASWAMEGMPGGVSCRAQAAVGETISFGVAGASINAVMAADGSV